MRRFRGKFVLGSTRIGYVGCLFPNGKIALQSEDGREIIIYAGFEEMRLDIRANKDVSFIVTFIDM